MRTRRFVVSGSFVLGGLLLVAATGLGDSWPRFRGPNGTGIATNQNIPVKWTKENILWKAALPGDGNSSPVIWEDKLFVQTASKDGMQRLLLCLNAKTGDQIWSKSASGGKAKIHVKNTFASSTPAVDGEHVFVTFWDGQNVHLTAFDLAGQKLWSRDLGSFTSQHGAGASPVVYKNKVILLNDQDGKASLMAFDTKTGDTLWDLPRPFYRACYGSPFLWERPDGTKELIVVSTLEVTGYNPDSGKENWHWAWKHTTKMPLRVTGSPGFMNNMIFCCAGDGGGDRGMVALDVAGNGKGTMAKQVWANKKDFPYVPSILCYKDYLFFVNDLGMAGCFEAKSGKKLWFQRISEAGFTSSPVLIDGNMYAADETGDVYVLAATPKFDVLSVNPLGERVRATPAVANQRLYIRAKDHLFCIGQVK
jgi:outer membrane protein assembly factor BamB